VTPEEEHAAEVADLRARWGEALALAASQGAMLDRNVTRAEGLLAERDAALAEVERLVEMLVAERAVSASLRARLASLGPRNEDPS
jgi:hypothetical protein